MFTKSHILRKGKSDKTLCGRLVKGRDHKGFGNGTCQNCLDIKNGTIGSKIDYWKRMRLA